MAATPAAWLFDDTGQKRFPMRTAGNFKRRGASNTRWTGAAMRIAALDYTGLPEPELVALARAGDRRPRPDPPRAGARRRRPARTLPPGLHPARGGGAQRRGDRPAPGPQGRDRKDPPAPRPAAPARSAGRPARRRDGRRLSLPGR